MTEDAWSSPGLRRETLNSYHDLTGVPSAEASGVPVLAEVNALPSPEVELTIGDRDIDRRPNQRALIGCKGDAKKQCRRGER